MASRLPAGIRLAVPVFPLVVGLVAGSWLSKVTGHSGDSLIIWRLFWWSLLSVVIGYVTWQLARVTLPLIPENPSGQYLSRAFRITRWSALVGLIVLLAGFVTSIWMMVTGRLARAPAELYWSLPVAAFLFTVIGPADTKLIECSRKRRCSELTPDQRAEYDINVLMHLYSFVRLTGSRQVPFYHLSAGPHVYKECTPELLPAALQKWKDRKLIVETKSGSLALSDAGYYRCKHVNKVGEKANFRQHERCQELSDEEKDSYQRQLLTDIARLAHHSPEPGSAGPTRSPEVVAMDELLLAQEHPCWPELIESALQTLSSLGLINLTERVTRPSSSRSLGAADDRANDVSKEQVTLTAKGRGVSTIMGGLSLEAAINKHEQQLRVERDRHKRCSEATSPQRVDFEDQFLMALYLITAGDTRPVEVGKVWARLQHECAPELTEHAIKIWHGRSDINVDDIDSSARYDYSIYEDAERRLSLTAAGRDLCDRAEKLDSMQKALKERREGYMTSNANYYIYGGQIAALGSNATAYSNAFQQFNEATDKLQLSELARELEKLGEELARQADSTEKRAAVGAVAHAELAAREGDSQGVWQHLAKVGKWVLDTATQIGVPVAVEAIKAVFSAR